jgi:hypothetical protein
MMLQSKLRQEQTIGDTAVSGLFRGLFAGAVMGTYLILSALLSGETVGAALSWFTPGMRGDALQGILLHLAVSGIYGIGFGLVRHWLLRNIPGWLGGLAYGLVLLVVADLVILPGAGLGLVEVTKFHLGAAHLLYGLILGILSR